MFDDAAGDFERIAAMVDNDGAVLILKDGKPAYAVVSFDDVQEAEPTPPVDQADDTEPRCACGRHAKSECHCGGNQAHGGHGHEHGPGGHEHGPGGHGHHHGGHGPNAHPHAHHTHPGAEETWEPHAGGYGHGGAGFGIWGDNGHPGFPFSAGDFIGGAATDFLGRGFPGARAPRPEFRIDDFIGKVPPDVIDAGQHLVGRLMDLFGGAGASSTGATATEPPVDQRATDESPN